MNKKELRISLEEAVYKLEYIIDMLDEIISNDYIEPLEDIKSVLDELNDFGILTFGCTDPRVNELYIAKRTDLPDYEEWADSLRDFCKQYEVTIGGDDK